MKVRFGSRKLIMAGVPAAVALLTAATTAFACTTYQGTWKVCGDVDPTFATCVTSTGTGVHTFTTTGSTSAHDDSRGAVKVSATGLKALATYHVNYNNPTDRTNDVDCMNAQHITTTPLAADASGNIAQTSAIPLPHLQGTGVGAVCAEEITPSLQGTGNEAPITMV